MAARSAERLYEIDKRIRAKQYPNAEALAKEWEISSRAVFDYRTQLLKMGAPLGFYKERGGWFYAEENWALPAMFVTEGELLAFVIATEAAQRQMSGATQEKLAMALEKIKNAMGGRIEVNLNELQNHYSFAPSNAAPIHETHFSDLQRAMNQQRTVTFEYSAHSTGEKTRRRVHPHLFHNDNGDWYLVAFDETRAAIRTFHLGRMTNLRVLSEGFARRPQEEIEAWKTQAFASEADGQIYSVAVRFDEYQARYIRERVFHVNQRIEEHKDGGCTLHFQSSGLGGLARWVLQYGAHAEVKKPKELRRKVQQEIAAMSTIYK